MFQSGGPSQLELFDYKPKLRELNGTRIAGVDSPGPELDRLQRQSTFPLWRPASSLHEQGQAGAWISELLPHTAKIVDDIAIIKSMQTDGDQSRTGDHVSPDRPQQPGRPSLGAWVSYGLGSAEQDLPAFMVLISQPNSATGRIGLYSSSLGQRLSAVQTSGSEAPRGRDPVLYLSNPPGIDARTRSGGMLDGIAAA